MRGFFCCKAYGADRALAEFIDAGCEPVDCVLSWELSCTGSGCSESEGIAADRWL